MWEQSSRPRGSREPCAYRLLIGPVTLATIIAGLRPIADPSGVRRSFPAPWRVSRGGTVARLGVMPRWLLADADRWRLGSAGRSYRPLRTPPISEHFLQQHDALISPLHSTGGSPDTARANYTYIVKKSKKTGDF